MVWEDDPNSASAEFVVNVANNRDRDATADSPGFTVFGRVVDGLEVADAIAALATETRGDLSRVPVEDVVIQSIERIELPERLRLTLQGDEYVENLEYGVATILRDILVDVLGNSLASALD